MQAEVEKGQRSPTAYGSRLEYYRLASAFDEAEGTPNEGLGCIHKLVVEMTTATSAMSNGNGDRMDNGQEYLKNACLRPAMRRTWPWEVREQAGEVRVLRGFESWRRRLRRSLRGFYKCEMKFVAATEKVGAWREGCGGEGWCGREGGMPSM